MLVFSLASQSPFIKKKFVPALGSFNHIHTTHDERVIIFSYNLILFKKLGNYKNNEEKIKKNCHTFSLELILVVLKYATRAQSVL